MSSLGYGSKSGSPSSEYPPFMSEPLSQMHPHDQAKKSNLQQRDLRIEVPRSAESGSLGDPFEFQDTGSATPPDFHNITQLPTPVMPSTTFSARSPVKIDVRKRNAGGAAPARNRIVSAFEPEPPGSPVSASGSSQTRHLSNPGFPVSVAGNEIPSPPSEPDQAAWKGRILLAPTLNKSFVCDDVVGSGAFSTVVRAHDTAEPASAVAAKIVSFPNDGCTSVSSFRSFVIRELGILAHVSHPCIIQLLDYNVSPPISRAEIRASFESGGRTPQGENLSGTENSQQQFFLNFCPGGNLFTWLSTHYHTSNSSLGFWRLMARVVAELVVSVAHMHKQLVIHRDLKLENILLNDNFEVSKSAEDPRLSVLPLSTITDFGLSKRLVSEDQLLSTKCGSQDYVSPELLMGLRYSGKLLDAWAIGVLVYSIIENRLPFDLPPPELLQSSGISPSVLRRRRSKHAPAHRIAMIDWDWYRALSMQQDDDLDAESKTIISNLQKLVEAFLVRKEKRPTVESALESEDFEWIKACVPSHFCS